MISLEEIQKKYPGAKYLPDPTCINCKGSGTKIITVDNETISGRCLCLHIENKTERNLWGQVLKKSAKQMKQELFEKEE